jgi:hypothetical protein
MGSTPTPSANKIEHLPTAKSKRRGSNMESALNNLYRGEALLHEKVIENKKAPK